MCVWVCGCVGAGCGGVGGGGRSVVGVCECVCGWVNGWMGGWVCVCVSGF